MNRHPEKASAKIDDGSARSLGMDWHATNASRRNTDLLTPTAKALKSFGNRKASSRGIVWQSKNANPLSRILKSNPDFSVLIVDDHPAMRSLIRSVLVSFGVFNVQEAMSGSEGLASIRRNVPNIAIVDYDMAPMNGLEFVRRVRRDPDSPDPSLPILMTTGVPDQHQIFEIRDAGATDILSKPFAPNAFVRHVVSILENKREFINSLAYCGPDRRRWQTSFSGSDRRCPVDVPLAFLARISQTP